MRTSADTQNSADQGTQSASAVRQLPELGSAASEYQENLYVPWWIWASSLIAAGVMAAEIHLGYQNLRAWLPYVLTLPLTAALLWWLGRVRIRANDTTLHVDDAHIPLAVIANVTPLSRSEKHVELGKNLAPWAFVIHRPWVASAVRIELNDPADATPYWIVSTRRPHMLAEAITRSLCR